MSTLTLTLGQSINQSNQIYIAPYVASKSEARDGGARQNVHIASPVGRTTNLGGGTVIIGGGTPTLGGGTLTSGGGTPDRGGGTPFRPVPAKFNHWLKLSL